MAKWADQSAMDGLAVTGLLSTRFFGPRFLPERRRAVFHMSAKSRRCQALLKASNCWQFFLADLVLQDGRDGSQLSNIEPAPSIVVTTRTKNLWKH